jgi:hypothetical protein
MEYIFTFTFDGDLILSIIEFLDPTIVHGLITNETIAQQACPK